MHDPRPGGGFIAWEEYRTDWVQLDAPRHFYLHTRKSMAYLAAEAGLAIVDCYCDSSSFQFLGSELYRRGISLDQGATASEAHFTVEQIADFDARTRTLNEQGRGDQAVFLLRKTASSGKRAGGAA